MNECVVENITQKRLVWWPGVRNNTFVVYGDGILGKRTLRRNGDQSDRWMTESMELIGGTGDRTP